MDEYQNWKKPKLYDECKSRNLRGCSRLNIDELIDVLIEDDQAYDAGGEQSLVTGHLQVLPLEVIFEITDKLNYSDVLRLCQTSTVYANICADPTFWRRKTNKDFSTTNRKDPLKHRETEQERYLRLATRAGEIYPGSEKYTSLYNISEKFIEIQSLDRSYFLHKFDESQLDDAMASAAREGDREIVDQMLKLGATNYNRAMMEAAGGGHQEIVNQMLELGATNYNLAMAFAAVGG